MTEKSKKIPYGKIITLLVLVAITVVSAVFNTKIFDEQQSIFNQHVSDNGVVQTLYGKIPALIRSVQIVTVALVLSIALRFVLNAAFTRTKRGLTIVKLLCSFVKWAIGIVAVLLILGAWGVNTGALLAGAGILSLIVGLGAQSLIADIIAGLFIVIEGEYQVGDIVIIDDWRGTVLEIGIRTTKIEDAGGNVKIINNSEIKSIVNQTQQLSVAKATIGIEYGESIPHVEIVIRDNLQKIGERIPAIVEGPYYKGVSALSASSVDLLFVAKCKEEDIYQVQRDLNRELKLMFDDNNINIPFPQVVVNSPVSFDGGTTNSEAKRAREFVEQQKELSRNIEEKSTDSILHSGAARAKVIADLQPTGGQCRR